MGGVIGLLCSCSKPLGTFSGTNTVAVWGTVPVISMPTKPALEMMDTDELAEYNKLPEKLRLKLQANDKKIKIYATQLEVAILDYDSYAEDRNKKQGVGAKK